MKKELLQITECVYELGYRFHILKTGKLPNRLAIYDVDAKRWEEVLEFIKNKYEWEKSDYLIDDENKLDGTVVRLYLIHLKDGITVFRSAESAFLYYDPNIKEANISELKKRFLSIKPEKNKSQSIGIIVSRGVGLDVQTFEYSLPKHSLIDYLSPKTKEFHSSVIKQLESKDGSGLYLMYGETGTGKTSFIKNILSKIEKKALFISTFFTESLTSPSLISLLMEYPDSILVIEDAETVLMERKADNSSAVSNLLNLTDGFLADFLNLKIICTFNTELNNIDDALLREGRLKGMHEFKKLSKTDAKEVAKVLGRSIDIDKPMTIAEVCNSTINLKKIRKDKLGFKQSFN